MVEEEGHEEIEENLTEWERVNYPRLHLLTNRFLSDPSNGLSIIDFSHSDSHDRRSIVFPPVNHEGLHISTPSTVSDHDDEQKNRSSSSGYDFNRVGPRVPLQCSRLPPAVSDAERFWSRGFRLLRSKGIKIAFSIRSIASRAGVLSTFNSPACVVPVTAALLLVLMFFRSRWLRKLRRRDERKDHLIRIIKEKDEKINQLLRQISHMNELLLALHRVPVSARPG